MATTSSDTPAQPVPVEGSREELTRDSPLSSWTTRLSEYATPSIPRSGLDLIASLGAYIVLFVVTYELISVSPWLALAIAPLTAGFLARTFIVFHDCTHGSFLPTRRANRIVGRICGLVTLAPFVRWQHDHAVHHATSGDLDRRGGGDVPTLTVAEYNARSPRARFGYRLFRNPVVMFGLGPILAMIIGPRIFTSAQRPRMRHSVMLTDLGVFVVFGVLIWLMGIGAFLLTWFPAALMAGSIGIWLFYVQHQHEQAYWRRHSDWSYINSALAGSSYLRLPKVLQFFTGNIGLHHVHHLNARIPNYYLQRAHDSIPVFKSVPVLSMVDGMRATRLKLWDEDGGRLVTFAQAKAVQRAL